MKDKYIQIFKSFCLKDEYANSDNITDSFNAIRKSYSYYENEMNEQNKNDYTNTISPYFLDWQFTPIETEAWNQIRYLSNLSLYPQYPLGKYFIDFANPYLRIAIEMDGADFHDPEKDYIRDCYMKKLGWKVFRIPGKKCFKPLLFEHQDEVFDPCEQIRISNEKWFMQTCDGILTAIAVIYFKEPFYDSYKEICMKSCLTYQS